MSIVRYFGQDKETGEPIQPDARAWRAFIEPVKAFLGVEASNNLWNSTGFNNFADSLADIYYRTETHGTSAYGQTNYRLLYSEINSDTADLHEVLDNNYIDYTSTSLALYIWDDTQDHDHGGFPVYWSDDLSSIEIPPNIFSMQPSILGIRRNENTPYNYRLYADQSDSDTYDLARIDIYGTYSYSIDGGGGYNTDRHDLDKVIVNLPLFATKSMAQDYLENGWTANNRLYLLNEKAEEAEELDAPVKTYYYNMNLLRNGTSVARRSFTLDIDSVLLNERYKGYIAAYKITGNDPYNIGFTADNDLVIKVIYHDDVGGTREYSSWDSFWSAHSVNEWSYIEYTLGSASDYYETNVTTNIPLWKDKNDADRYLRDELTLDDSLNQGKDIATIKIRTGSELNKTDNEEVTTSSANRCYQLSESDLTMFSNVLWSSSEAIQTEIVNSTRITNNPIDLVINCFKYPFNINNYCNMGSRSVIKVGSYETGIACPTVTGLKVTRIGSSFVKPIFNNFLDFQAVNTFIYLPYYGLASIDFKMIINTVLSIDMAIDPYNGSIKYYIKADDKLIEEYGAQVGMSVPLTGSDSASKQREIVQSNVQGLSQAAGLLQSAGNLDIMGAIQGLNNINNIGAQINAEPVAISKGSNAPGVGMMDIKYPYLIFDIQENITPSNLYSTYGYPCNKIGTIGSSSGYTEAVDVFLTGSMLETEKSEIISLINQGIIV